MVSKVLIYHTALSENSTPDDLDVEDEAEFVSNNLKKLGYQVDQKPFNYTSEEDIKRINEYVRDTTPSFIFNLVEAINGKDSLAYLAPVAFEKFGIPYTGCTKSAFLKTENKTRVKHDLKKAGIPTPYWLTLKDMQREGIPRKRFIIKSKIDHASKHLEANLLEDPREIKDILFSKRGDFFAEEYIDGREFNISIIGPLKKGKVLPIPEINFNNWPSNKPKIVDYSAKWDENSHAYNNTERSFDFPQSDSPLLETLEDICKRCWDIFNLRGYARVDFRVDKNNNPYVLEINANPCISPDAGFVAASRKAGITDEEIIRTIIKDSCGPEFVL